MEKSGTRVRLETFPIGKLTTMAGTFSTASIEQVRAASNLVQVIGAAEWITSESLPLSVRFER